MPSRPVAPRPLRRALAVVGTCLAVAASGVAASGGAAPRDPVPAVVQVAKQQVGDAYVLGGNGPDRWDCSGLTSFLWGHVGGVEGVPRVSRDQQRWAVPVPREQLLPGDLVFFDEPVSHVGLYVGDGRMVDASSSRRGVVERPLWTSGIVRYGRVPRPGMPAVRPFTPVPLPTASPAPVAPRPSAAPAVGGQSAPRPATTAARPTAAPATSAPAVVPLRGLPATQRVPSSAVMLKAVAGARTVVGSRGWSDLELVRVAWRHAGGGVLPDDRAALVARATPVALADARIGDLVVYGAPAQHVGLYLGWGYMVDSSKVLGQVVVRRVFASDTVRLVRLPVTR